MTQIPSRLLALPRELQLIIFEFAVTSDKPLLVNCLCDSSYGGWTDEYYQDRDLWASGERRPPAQPSLTRTCRSIRWDTIPMYYKLNNFEAGYCHETDTDIVYRWLRAMGKENRAMMHFFRFFDANDAHDDYNEFKDLKAVLRGPVVREMDGLIDSIYADGCSHEVTFSLEELDPMDGFGRLFGSDEVGKAAACS